MMDERPLKLTGGNLLIAFVVLTLCQTVGTMICISRTVEFGPRVENAEENLIDLRKYTDRRVDYLRRYIDKHLAEIKSAEREQ